MVQPSSENRRLQVAAQSADYYRASEIQLDGASTPALTTVDFRDLPIGLYEVTGVLLGSHGPRATVAGFTRVEGSPGAGR
jgi:hypothetical protein